MQIIRRSSFSEFVHSWFWGLGVLEFLVLSNLGNLQFCNLGNFGNLVIKNRN
jgi:hypothetical protein